MTTAAPGHLRADAPEVSLRNHNARAHGGRVSRLVVQAGAFIGLPDDGGLGPVHGGGLVLYRVAFWLRSRLSGEGHSLEELGRMTFFSRTGERCRRSLSIRCTLAMSPNIGIMITKGGTRQYAKPSAISHGNSFTVWSVQVSAPTASQPNPMPRTIEVRNTPSTRCARNLPGTRLSPTSTILAEQKMEDCSTRQIQLCEAPTTPTLLLRLEILGGAIA